MNTTVLSFPCYFFSISLSLSLIFLSAKVASHNTPLTVISRDKRDGRGVGRAADDAEAVNHLNFKYAFVKCCIRESYSLVCVTK